MDHVWELAELIQERNMIYVKSVLAGVAALLVASVVPVTCAVTTGWPYFFGPEDFGGAHMLVNTDADLLIMILPGL